MRFAKQKLEVCLVERPYFILGEGCIHFHILLGDLPLSTIWAVGNLDTAEAWCSDFVT